MPGARERRWILRSTPLHRRSGRAVVGSAAILWFALVTASCGYRVAGQGNHLPEHLRLLAVPAFENQTMLMGVEQRLTEAVMREFIRRSRFDVVGREGGADAVLRGTVVSVRTLPVIFDPDTGRASAVQVELKLSVELVDLRDNTVLFTRPDYVFREDYEITSDLESFFEERSPALGRLARDFATTLVSAILENF